jgi:hypothetical protein
VRRRWLSRQALLLHLAVIVWFPGCLIAFWWQVHRAFSGNGLSYLYSVEWPAFAVVGVWAWWQLVHTDPGTVGRQAQERMAAARAARSGTEPPGTLATHAPAATTAGPVPAAGSPVAASVRRREDEDEALAAYNDRLARLASRGPKTWRHP